MKNISILVVFSLFILSFSCKKEKKADEVVDKEVSTEQNTSETSEKKKTEIEYKEAKLTVPLLSKSNSTATGNVVFRQEKGIVTMIALVIGLSEGEHAIHLHEKSDCSSEDGSSAGGHWNPTAQPHGKWGDEKGFHKGDIGNFTANADGRGTITFSTDEWCIGCGDPNKDIIGKSVIVHEGTDDFTSQPSGAAGARVSCGGIIQ